MSKFNTNRKPLRIKDLPRVERPREKLAFYGPEKLSDTELLALLLGSGKKGENALELAAKVLKKFSKGKLTDASLSELKNGSGIGIAKACEIVACFELGKRLLKGKKAKIYLSPKEVWQELRDYRNHKKEHFFVFYLDSRNQEIKREIVSVGSLNVNSVHPREVFEPAIKNLAAQVILAHNHPSGNSQPSEADLALTKRLAEAGKLLGIEVTDHIIIAESGYFSFKAGKLI